MGATRVRAGCGEGWGTQAQGTVAAAPARLAAMWNEEHSQAPCSPHKSPTPGAAIGQLVPLKAQVLAPL